MDLKQQVIAILETEEIVEEGEVVGEKKLPSVADTRHLRYLVENGHWESLAENPAYLVLSPADKVHTMIHAVNNRASEMRNLLTPMARSRDTQDTYIQMLNHIHELEQIVEELLKGHYSKKGNRQLNEENSKDPYEFY